MFFASFPAMQMTEELTRTADQLEADLRLEHAGAVLVAAAEEQAGSPQGVLSRPGEDHEELENQVPHKSSTSVMSACFRGSPRALSR